MNPDRFLPCVVVHIPHDATTIPADVRGQFLLTDEELRVELCQMTDHLTEALFTTGAGEAVVVRAPVSRLVVDVERFADDVKEPMAARGMGAIYRVTSSLAPLRRRLSEDQRSALMQAWYYPHHHRLENAVATAMDRHGQCHGGNVEAWAPENGCGLVRTKWSLRRLLFRDHVRGLLEELKAQLPW